METKNINDYLNQFFQEITLYGLNDNNSHNIEVFLTSLIDTNENNIFNNILLYNFINLLNNQDSSTFLINHLIKEVELKGLRLTYKNIINNNANNNQNNVQNCCNNKNMKKPNNSLDEETQLKNFNDTPLSEILAKTEAIEGDNK